MECQVLEPGSSVCKANKCSTHCTIAPSSIICVLFEWIVGRDIKRYTEKTNNSNHFTEENET